MAQIRVEHSHGARRGSGYWVSDTAVLTAAHVVADARSVTVVFNADLADEWATPATVALSASAGDVAVLEIEAPTGQPQIEAARFGRIARRAAVLECRAVGFPRFKLRVDQSLGDPSAAFGSYRDAHQADGTIGSLSGWREGTLEITVAPPEPEPEPEHSPWEGMSGAAVWCADRIVGVVSRHHRNEGLNRLAAVRVTRWYDQLDSGAVGQLQRLLGLASRADQLPDVIPPEPGQRVLADYTEQVEGIAPVSLQNREQELAELTAFCAGDEFYAWWQADPWAGKTALASWFALRPPVGVTVVSFFITRRLAGQADSSAFTEALIEQLSTLTREPGLRAERSAARDGQRRRLLKEAATRVAQAGGRLLLLVDGLDEDEGVPPASPSSIAAMLPDRPIEGLRVLVTSRPRPGLPHDVRPDHPLSRLQARSLSASELGEQLKILAKTEMTTHLRAGDRLTKEIIGFIAAAGGLTVDELRELTGATFVDVRSRLDGVFGRSLGTRLATNLSTDRAGPVYLFAHDTLRELAEQELGSDLDDYRQRVHRWADSYQEAHWPDATPRYLGRPYSELLIRLVDLRRLVQLITQQGRHDWMRTATTTDAAALAEIGNTQQELLAAPRPDLIALALTTAERYRLSVQNDSLPVQLPALWVDLGRPDRAELLTRAISDPQLRAQALIEVARALATAAQPERMEWIASMLTDLYLRTKVLCSAAEALAEAGRDDLAIELARTITVRHEQDRALIAVSAGLAAAGQLDRAEELAQTIDDRHLQNRALASVAAGLLAVGRSDRAEQLACAITGRNPRVALFYATARALVNADRPDRAQRLAAAAEELARTIDGRWGQTKLILTLVNALRAVGWPNRVDRLTRIAKRLDDIIDMGGFTDNSELVAATEVMVSVDLADRPEQAADIAVRRGGWRGQDRDGNRDRHDNLLATVVEALAAAKQLDRAEQLAQTITDLNLKAAAQAAVAEALVTADQADRAEELAYTFADPTRQAEVLTTVARALIRASQAERARVLASAAQDLSRAVTLTGREYRVAIAVTEGLTATARPDLAERLALAITDPIWQSLALNPVIEALAIANDPDRAAHVALSITNSSWRESSLVSLARILADSGQPDRAEELARAHHYPLGPDQLLARMAEALSTNHPDRAEQLARTITKAELRTKTLATVARTLATTGETIRAQHLATLAETEASTIADLTQRSVTLALIVDTLAITGQLDRAEQLASLIIDQDHQAQAQTAVTKALADRGQLDRAEQLASSIVDPERRAEALAAVVEALSASDQSELAERLIGNIEHPQWQAQALRAVAQALAAINQADRAEQLARRIPDQKRQADALAAIATILATNDHVDRAEELARTIPNASGPDGGLDLVAKALADAGQPDLAEQLARDITDLGQQAWTLVVIAKSLAVAGLLDRAQELAIAAQQLALKATYSYRHAQTLTEVVAALAAADKLDRAEQVARTITDPDDQAQALLTVLDGFQRKGLEPLQDRPGAIIATLLAGASWFRAIPALAATYPEAVIAIGESMIDWLGKSTNRE